MKRSILEFCDEFVFPRLCDCVDSENIRNAFLEKINEDDEELREMLTDMYEKGKHAKEEQMTSENKGKYEALQMTIKILSDTLGEETILKDFYKKKYQEMRHQQYS